MIKPDMTIETFDGPSYAPNHKRTVRVHKPSDVPGAWVCTDFKTGELLVIQEAKLIQGLKEQANE
jgi:hypothetical protein